MSFAADLLALAAVAGSIAAGDTVFHAGHVFHTWQPGTVTIFKARLGTTAARLAAVLAGTARLPLEAVVTAASASAPPFTAITRFAAIAAAGAARRAVAARTATA
ncbi:hypothetical protein GCM10007052_32960 [Halioglobus japonicus]|nr:hypothetical protein GCM10007052_32960 [Halioglobus japonicus]